MLYNRAACDGNRRVVCVVLERQNGVISQSIEHVGIILSTFTKINHCAVSNAKILGGFGDAGLVPSDPDRVPAKLHIKTLTPPSSSSNRSFYVKRTPATLYRLEKQKQQIRDLQIKIYLMVLLQSKCLKALEKGAEMAMQNSALFQHRVHQLYMSNKHQKEKKKTRAFIQYGGNSYSFAEVVYSDVFHDGAVGMTWRGLTLETRITKRCFPHRK